MLYSLCYAICFCFVITSNISGKWVGKYKFSGDDDSITLSYDFKLDSTDQTILLGSCTGPDGTVPITNGKINGSEFSFDIVGNSTAHQSGKYYRDSIGIDLIIGDLKAHSTLKRVEANN